MAQSGDQDTREQEAGEEPSDWYIRTVLGAELADYTAVRGSIAIRPYGFAVWENIQAHLDLELKRTGHKNAYFPLFIPESFIEKEAQHVEGFAPELAVVTHGGNKKLEEPLIVRPTSETIINHMYCQMGAILARPAALINQWANVVRWEMRTRLFLRGTEFLWQEGHTAHATLDEAEAEARLILDLYITLIEGELAIPVRAGRKSEREKFAGARSTYTMESLMRDGKALQMGTSHNLGQNFGRAFDVRFLDRDGEQKFPWSTSWAVSTRLIGALVLVHGDEKGLILPPRIAPIQVVVVPIWRKDAEREVVEPVVAEVEAQLASAGIRVEVDSRDTVTPGFKFNDWELKGVPLRLEIGPRDVASRQVMVARRDTREKSPVPIDGLANELVVALETVQTALFERAMQFTETNTHEVATMEALADGLDKDAGFYWVNWCGSDECEDAFIELKASIRAIPLDEVGSTPTGPCINCGNIPQSRVLVAKSY